MSDETETRQQKLAKLQEELNRGALSRRQFIDRLAVLGLGFGAAAGFAGSADAKPHPDQGVTVGSTNPNVDVIAAEGREEALGEEEFDVAQYRRRRYRRYYRRFYRRYRRFYRRYRRFYRRYRRFYRRYYRRF